MPRRPLPPPPAPGQNPAPTPPPRLPGHLQHRQVIPMTPEMSRDYQQWRDPNAPVKAPWEVAPPPQAPIDVEAPTDLSIYPGVQGYVDRLPVGHPDIERAYRLAIDAESASEPAKRWYAQQLLSQAAPPEGVPEAPYFQVDRAFYPDARDFGGTNPQPMVGGSDATSQPGPDPTWLEQFGANLQANREALTGGFTAGLERHAANALGGLNALAARTPEEAEVWSAPYQRAVEQSDWQRPYLERAPGNADPKVLERGAAIDPYSQFVGEMTPYVMPISGSLTGAASEAGRAQAEGKSDVGLWTNAALGGLPGLGGPAARGLQSLTRAPAVVAHGAAGAGLMGAMPAVQSLETQYIENNPELAQQEREAIFPSAAVGGGLEALMAIASRGRGAFRPVPRPNTPDVPVPYAPEARHRGEFDPVEVPPDAELPQSTRPGTATEAALPPVRPGEFQSPLTPEDARPIRQAAPTEPELPAIERGDFRQTGTSPVRGELGMPQGTPGGLVRVGAALDDMGMPSIKPGPEVRVREPSPGGFTEATRMEGPVPEGGLPDVLPGARVRAPGRDAGGYIRADIDQPGGYRPIKHEQFREGYYEPAPRRPDILPQQRTETALGEAPITDPAFENAVTRTGSDLSPVELETRPNIQPQAPGERIRRARSETTPGDPYARTFAASKREQELGDSTVDIDPLDQFEPEQIGNLARADKSLPETEVQLSPVEQRAAAPTQSVEPVTGVSGNRRPDIVPEGGERTTQLTPPVKPGAKNLSPEAQDFIAGLKPGERAAIQDSIDYLRRNPDPQGDAANLRFALEAARAKRRPKGEPPAQGGADQRRPFGAKTNDAVRDERFAAPKKVEAPSEARTDVPPVRSDVPNRGEGEPPLETTLAAGLHPKALEPATNAVKGIMHLPWRIASNLFKVRTSRLYDVVAGMPGGKPLAEKARKVLDKQHELIGELSPYRERFLKAVKGRDPKAKATRASFEEQRWNGNAGYARIHDVLNQQAAPRPHEAPAINAYAQGFHHGGKMSQDRKVMMTLADGREVPFIDDPNRLRALRVYHRDFYWYANNLGHPETQRFVDTILAENPGLKREAVVKEFQGLASRSITKRGPTEDARVIKNMPTHYKDSNGNIVQILETDPHQLIDAVTRRLPQRLAFIEYHGQGSIPKEFEDFVNASTDNRKAGENLYRALNGMSLDDVGGSWFEAQPGTPQAFWSRALLVPWNAYKGAKLQLAPLANLPETIGKGRAISGGNPLKLIKAGFDASFLNHNSGAVLDDLAQRGVFTRDVMDWYYNKSDLPETLNRYTLNTTGALNQFVNEFNERVVARMADMWAESLKAGKGGSIDKFRLRILDFNNDEITQILKGSAPKSLYNAVTTRAVEWAQASTSLPAERSRAAGSRWWNMVTIADRFSQMNLNRNFNTWAKMFKVIGDGNSSWKDRAGAVAFTLDLTASQTLAGATTLILRAVATGGAAVLADKAFGSPLGMQDLLMDAAAYALLGAPEQAVLQIADDTSRNSVMDSLAGPILPASFTQDLVDMMKDQGRYRDMSWTEKAAKFLRSANPAAPVAANIIGVLGITESHTEMDAAMREYWNWRRKYAPTSQTSPVADDTGFRSNMRRAAQAIRNGEQPNEYIREAMRVKEDRYIAASLRARRLLHGLKPAEYRKLREYVGENTMAKLEQYDAMLEAWASAIKPPKR